MKPNKLRLVKRLSIGIGLALSFGNAITASPSFAQNCTSLNGQTICSKREEPAIPANRQRTLEPPFSCKNIIGFSRDCSPPQTIPPNLVDPRTGLPKTKTGLPQPEPRPGN
jgi:hypothetical protein